MGQKRKLLVCVSLMQYATTILSYKTALDTVLHYASQFPILQFGREYRTARLFMLSHHLEQQFSCSYVLALSYKFNYDLDGKMNEPIDPTTITKRIS